MPSCRIGVAATFALSALCACSSNEPSTPTPEVSSLVAPLKAPTLAYAVTSIAAPATILPKASATVSITLENTGTATWTAVELRYAGDAGLGGGTLKTSGNVRPGRRATFTGALVAPDGTGVYTLAWQPVSNGAAFGAPINAGKLEVTCSDGAYCNGPERWAGGSCRPAADPCDDHEDCTVDSCDEALDRCKHDLVIGCDSCKADNCTPHCQGAVCGSDGCGGSCGTCPSGLTCLSGTCGLANQPGTCASPLPLLQPGEPLLGPHLIHGDTSVGLDETQPTCNLGTHAPELTYVFTLTAPTGIDARSHDYDTVLHLRSTCGDPGATLGCSDDSAPPGDYGSRVAVLLQPGTYYLIVDGFDDTSYGPFTLDVRFADNCVPQCDGRYCSADDGCGGTCGTCPTGEECTTAGRCVPSPCAPDCKGKQCGDDGCGGTCGTCAAGDLCVVATGACKSFPVCDHFKPSCKDGKGCATNEWCGSDCECHKVSDPMPDLIVNVPRLETEIRFDTANISPASCAIVEGCVEAPGARKLLRFSVQVDNLGQDTMHVPAPEGRPDLFVYSPCHGHYHFQGFATFSLLDLNHQVILVGRKQAYCMEDTVRVVDGPQIACEKAYDCEDQGIQAGWADLYGNALDCQWLDITDVAPGNYLLQVQTNPGRAFEELSFDNNTAEIPVTIP